MDHTHVNQKMITEMCQSLGALDKKVGRCHQVTKLVERTLMVGAGGICLSSMYGVMAQNDISIPLVLTVIGGSVVGGVIAAVNGNFSRKYKNQISDIWENKIQPHLQEVAGSDSAAELLTALSDNTRSEHMQQLVTESLSTVRQGKRSVVPVPRLG